jgi:hypothetical protein
MQTFEAPCVKMYEGAVDMFTPKSILRPAAQSVPQTCRLSGPVPAVRKSP